MNYKANEIDWKINDVVIHDCDAKKQHMLMIVEKIEVTRYGKLYHTRYLYAGNNTNQRKVWKNGKEVLHNPKRFDIKIPNLKIESEQGEVVKDERVIK